MNELRRLGPHFAALLVAGAVAFQLARPKEAGAPPPKAGEVDLWSAKAQSVSKVQFEDERQKVSLERKSDKAGDWYLGKVEPVKSASEPEPAPKTKDPHGHGKTPPKRRAVEAASFVSVSVAKKLAEKLARMRATRSIGVVGDDKLATFGFDKPQGTLRVTVGAKEHVLLVGATTPGTGKRYVRNVQTKEVYVVDGSPMRDMKSGAGRLSERSQHSWKNADVERATIIAGGNRRAVVRSGTAGRRFWANPDATDKPEETVGNWLSKVQRLRPIKYRDSLPAGASLVVRVEYATSKDTLGFLEVHSFQEGAREAYAVKSEQLRMFAVVTSSVAKQVKSDLSSVVEGAGPEAEAADAKAGGSASATAAPKPPATAPANAPRAKPPAAAKP